MADELRRVVTQHTGADFEAGRVGHRNGPQIAGILDQVVSASGAERNWSVYGRIKHKGRSRLAHEKADKLVYCNEALHLRSKLVKAGFKNKLEKWESDSDSDMSSDEEDYMA